MNIFGFMHFFVLLTLFPCFHLRKQTKRIGSQKQSEAIVRQLLLLQKGNPSRRQNVQLYVPRIHYSGTSKSRKTLNSKNRRRKHRMLTADKRKIVKKGNNKRRYLFNSKRISNPTFLVSSNDLIKLVSYAGRSKDRERSSENRLLGRRGRKHHLSKTMRDSIETYNKRQRLVVTKESQPPLMDLISDVSITPYPTLSNLPVQSILQEAILPKSLVEAHNGSSNIANNKITEPTITETTTVIPRITNGAIQRHFVLEKLKTVLLIKDNNSRRDAMKELVKDIVSDGGILSKNETVSANVDIATLDDILEMIKNISNKLKTSSNRNTIAHILPEINAKIPEKQPFDSRNIVNFSNTKLNLNVNMKERSPHTGVDIVNQNRNLNKHKQQSLEHLAGRSVYGEHFLSVDGASGLLDTSERNLTGKLMATFTGSNIFGTMEMCSRHG